MNVFVYGTLLDDALVQQLTGRHFRKTPAVLDGYRRILSSHGYPDLVRDARAQVHGAILYGVDGEALRAFDTYEDEGRLYKQTEVTVLASGHKLSAIAYVGPGGTITY